MQLLVFLSHLCVEMMLFNYLSQLRDLLSNFCLDGGIVYSVINLQARAIKDM